MNMGNIPSTVLNESSHLISRLLSLKGEGLKTNKLIIQGHWGDMWQNWVSNPVARVHTVIHSTVVLSIRAGLLVKIEPNASALLCFQGNLCTKSLKILEPSESFFFFWGGGTFWKFWNVSDPQANSCPYLFMICRTHYFVNCIVQIIMYWSPLIYQRVISWWTHRKLKTLLSKMHFIYLTYQTAQLSLTYLKCTQTLTLAWCWAESSQHKLIL